MLVCYPKSGSTWLRFVVAQALMAQEIDFDSVGRVSPRLDDRFQGVSGRRPAGTA